MKQYFTIPFRSPVKADAYKNDVIAAGGSALTDEVKPRDAKQLFGDANAVFFVHGWEVSQ